MDSVRVEIEADPAGALVATECIDAELLAPLLHARPCSRTLVLLQDKARGEPVLLH